MLVKSPLGTAAPWHVIVPVVRRPQTGPSVRATSLNPVSLGGSSKPKQSMMPSVPTAQIVPLLSIEEYVAPGASISLVQSTPPSVRRPQTEELPTTTEASVPAGSELVPFQHDAVPSLRTPQLK